MIITKCDKKCIFVNLVGFCCLDDHKIEVKHTEAQCQRGQALAKCESLGEYRKQVSKPC